MDTYTHSQYENQCQKMIQVAETFLPLEQWGFQYSKRLVKLYSDVIYNSEWCRVKFMWLGTDLYGGDTIAIFYGRLHALDDEKIMTWNGEKCYCWHSVENSLNFLDGMSPQEAVEAKRKWPRVMEQFQQSELGKSLTGVRRQPEWLIRMHAAVWEYYGNRLFELFDLRHPELWDEYTQFTKEFYVIKGLSPNISPPQNQIC